MSGLNAAWRSKRRPEAPAAAGMAVEEGEEDTKRKRERRRRRRRTSMRTLWAGPQHLQRS
jgi:hypothetical protein